VRGLVAVRVYDPGLLMLLDRRPELEGPEAP
jgi:hypothetical protein